MGQKATDIQENETGLTARQLRVLDRTLGGRTSGQVNRIARELGVKRSTIYRDLRKIKASSWYDEQVQRIQAIGGYAFANVFTHILNGKYEAGVEYMKGTGIYRPKLEVSGSIEQKLSDEEIADKAKQVILEVIQEAKAKSQVKKDIDDNVSRETKALQIEPPKGQGDRSR